MGNHRLYPAADAFQPPLLRRCGFQARLTPSVRPQKVLFGPALWSLWSHIWDGGTEDKTGVHCALRRGGAGDGHE